MDFKFNLVLTGFMGAGKSTIAKLIANELNWAYVDTDHRIEQAQNLTTQAIFDTYGQTYFRQQEYKLLNNLIKEQTKIIATGGGMLIMEKNIELLRAHSLVYFLDVPFDILWKRIQNDRKRPMLKNSNKKEIAELYISRQAVYKQFFSVDCQNKNQGTIAKLIITHFIKWNQFVKKMQ